MIVTETLAIRDQLFTRIYSDIGCMIERDGILYSEAIDPAYLNRSYNETTELIEGRELSEIEQKALAYDILMGNKE